MTYSTYCSSMHIKLGIWISLLHCGIIAIHLVFFLLIIRPLSRKYLAVVSIKPCNAAVMEQAIPYHLHTLND